MNYKMNHKGMTLSSFFIALFVIGMLSAGYMSLLQDINSKFTGINESIINTTRSYNHLKELHSNVEVMRNQTASNSNSILDVLGFFTKGGYSMLVLTFDSYSIFSGMLNTVATVLHLPEWAVLGIAGIIMVLILFAIASAIFRINT